VKNRPNRRWVAAVALAISITLVAAACGDDKKDSSSSGSGSSNSGAQAATSIGKGEGKLDLIAWAGYAEDGSNDPKVDWVTQFEKDTGCQTDVKVGNTSDEMVQLMQTGNYDGVSASGNASQRLIASSEAAPINTKLVTTYNDIAPFLKDQSSNSADGKVYGIPHGWGANLLQFNTDVVKPAPDSWSVVYDPKSPYKGKITAYDDWTTIADAANYLRATKPDLKITNPYALDQTQFDAAVALAKEQKPLIGEYWSDYLKSEEAFTKGSIVLGTTWQIITNTLQGQTPPVPVKAVLPKEGSTAWSDNWMISSKAKHPNCMYEWINYITAPAAQAQVAEYFGEAPANLKACDQTTDPQHCTTFGANDPNFYKQLWFWVVPTTTCLDGRTDVQCVGYQDWVKAWAEIKG
jgi:putative spermidine/putrescine transport system substrate-binding protein